MAVRKARVQAYRNDLSYRPDTLFSLDLPFVHASALHDVLAAFDDGDISEVLDALNLRLMAEVRVELADKMFPGPEDF